MQTTLGEALDYYEEKDPRGEYVLVIAGKDPGELAAEQAAEWAEMSIADHVASYEAQGMSRREAMKAAAADRGVSKRDIYAALLSDENGAE